LGSSTARSKPPRRSASASASSARQPRRPARCSGTTWSTAGTADSSGAKARGTPAAKRSPAKWARNAANTGSAITMSPSQFGVRTRTRISSIKALSVETACSRSQQLLLQHKQRSTARARRRGLGPRSPECRRQRPASDPASAPATGWSVSEDPRSPVPTTASATRQRRCIQSQSSG